MGLPVTPPVEAEEALTTGAGAEAGASAAEDLGMTDIRTHAALREEAEAAGRPMFNGGEETDAGGGGLLLTASFVCGAGSVSSGDVEAGRSLSATLLNGTRSDPGGGGRAGQEG